MGYEKSFGQQTVIIVSKEKCTNSINKRSGQLFKQRCKNDMFYPFKSNYCLTGEIFHQFSQKKTRKIIQRYVFDITIKKGFSSRFHL